jgi:hypothetical protein
MKILRKRLAAILVAFALVLSHGCKKDAEPLESQDADESAQTQPVSGSENQIVADDTSISDLISTWDAGKKDEATNQFLTIEWQDATVLKQIRGLSMSEEALTSLPDADRQSIVEETMNLLGSMRKLFFHVASEAEGLAGSGEKAKAEKYLNAIRQYGISLSGPDHLQIVQMHGKAAAGYADKKLSELK